MNDNGAASSAGAGDQKTLLQKAARHQDIEEVRYAANLTDHMSER